MKTIGGSNMNDLAKQKIEKIKMGTFGVEVEMYDIRRTDAAYALGELWETSSTVDNEGGYYNVWSVQDKDGRRWKFMSDSSISDCWATRTTIAEYIYTLTWQITVQSSC